MYQVVKTSRSECIRIRGLNYRIRHWGSREQSKTRVPIIMLHGWMDVSASFQFLVDCLKGDYWIIAPDWRGYGASLNLDERVDCYWFPDYLADLDHILDHYELPLIDCVAHSMGGNVATFYAGIRPSRVRRLVNLEGYGLPSTQPTEAPRRYARWLDELKGGARLKSYTSLAEVAARLKQNNPRLPDDYAQWLASEWSQQIGDEYHLRADPAHKLVNPVLYRTEEALACWRAVTASVLLLESDTHDDWHAFTRSAAYRERLKAFNQLRSQTIANAGHMLHHDQPAEVARVIEEFLN